MQPAPASTRLHAGVDPSRLHWAASDLARDASTPVWLPPERSGLHYAGLQVIKLRAGDTHTVDTGECEYAVVTLHGHVVVAVDDARFEPAARPSIFHIGDVVYAPRDAALVITAVSDSAVALPSCRARRRLDAFHIPAGELPNNPRGAGAASRQIIDTLGPDVGHADRMVLVEGFAPGGSWSSYPPHKHDDPDADGEAVLEEIYYFRLDGPNAWAVHRTYDLEEEWDVTATVRNGDVFLVPRGYHGPTITPPEYTLYFLNVLAGDADERSLAFSDDPAHAWIRDTWPPQQLDPRLPIAREST